MKKIWIIIGIIGIIILFSIFFKFVYFSDTEVKVVDIEGNYIEGAEVRISYSCQKAVLDVGGGEHFRQFGYREGVTDIGGFVHFNSLNKGVVYNFPFMFNCKKRISVEKEGYCPNHEINPQKCLDENYVPKLLSKKEISELPIFLSKVISWSKREGVLILKKIDGYEAPNYNCKVFWGECKENFVFDEIVLTQDLSRCDMNFLDYDAENRFFMYQCFIEIAIAKKDVSICEQIYYTDKAETTRDKFNPRYRDNNPDYDTDEFRRRCFEIMAKELKEITICDKAIFDKFQKMHNYKDNCKFEVLKETKDISKCSQIEKKEIREFCEVYLS